MRIFNKNNLLLAHLFSKSKFTSYKDVTFPNSCLSKTFMRSSGPGGQSVNTTNSKAQVRVLISQCPIITTDPFISQNLYKKYPNFINKSGEIIVTSQVHKSQKANLQECIEKLQKIVFNCSQVPQERKYDIPPQTQELEEMRIQSKRKKSDVKQRRNSKNDFY